ncbi:MAG: ribosome maturation factor RimP [Clostridia bacterium]|nr:ribosome maturation factor RimP [Clostridia bacterium]
MANKQRNRGVSLHAVERIAESLAREQELELVEVTLQKESRGMVLCLFADKEGGITLDDCERYHKRIQPLLEAVDYDILEVSSPGIDRAIKTVRDFEKNRDALVEVKLFAAVNGSKIHRGRLRFFSEDQVSVIQEDGQAIAFPRKTVAVVKPVVSLEGLEDQE